MRVSPKEHLCELRAFWNDVRAKRLREHLKEKLAKPVWIYGAGGYGRRIFKLLNGGIQCVGFIDRRADNRPFVQELEVPVRSPEAFSKKEAQDHTLVIGIMNPNVSISVPKHWARNFPFFDVIEPGELPEILGSGASIYWLDTRSTIADSLEKISELTSLLADDQSVETVLSLTRFRLSADVAQHPEPDIKHKYLPPDLAKMIRQPIVFVDGGAFNGDTAEAFLAQGVKIAEWYAFEPDPGNFRALVASPARDAIPRTIMFPCGLGATLCEINFVAESTASSHAATQPAEGKSTIKIVTLDDVLFGITPTLIKLDIEGYEADALAGMQRTLKKNSVFFAMSIYHKPADLWELPLLVRELMPNAKLYIRQHGFNGFDTVLYAIT